MKITTYRKDIKPNTILKDSDGYFLIESYDRINKLYHYIDCNEHGIILDREMIGVLSPSELIGAEIIK